MRLVVKCDDNFETKVCFRKSFFESEKDMLKYIIDNSIFQLNKGDSKEYDLIEKFDDFTLKEFIGATRDVYNMLLKSDDTLNSIPLYEEALSKIESYLNIK